MKTNNTDFDGLSASLFNYTPTKSPDPSHTQLLKDVSSKMLKQTGGIPAQGNQRSEWDAGARFDFENPEYR